jgi:hypothetical protein
MSIAHFFPRRKGQPAAVLALPPPEAWPPPEQLLSRAALAELFGVSVAVIRAWERRGKGPPRAFAQGQEPRYRCGEAREWLEREVARQEAFARVSRSFAALMEEPAEVPPEAPVTAQVAPPTTPADRQAVTVFERELERHFPVSTTTLHNEALQRRAEELGPIEGF